MLEVDMQKVQDFKRTCFVEDENGTDYALIVKAIIWTCVLVDLPGIPDEKALQAFLKRNALVCRIGMNYAEKKHADGTMHPWVITAEELRPYLGLKVNVAPTTEAKFKGKVMRIIVQESARLLQEAA